MNVIPIETHLATRIANLEIEKAESIVKADTMIAELQAQIQVLQEENAKLKAEKGGKK